MAARMHAFLDLLGPSIRQPKPLQSRWAPKPAIPAPCPTARSRLGMWILRGTILLASVALGLVGTAAVVRLAWAQPVASQCTIELGAYAQADPDFPGHPLPQPNVDGVQPGSDIRFTTNSRGLRDRDYVVPKPPGVSRVVALGNSFTWGTGVGDVEVFAEIMESSFIDIEVINLGVPGFDVRSELRHLEREGMRYEPDVVVLAISRNDMHNTEQLKADILRMDDFVRTNSGRLLIALIPARQAVEPRTGLGWTGYNRDQAANPELDKPYQVIEDFARTRDIAVCNPLTLFRYRHRQGDRLYLRRDMHFNTAGHRLFAEAIRPVVASMLTVPEPRSDGHLACSRTPGS